MLANAPQVDSFTMILRRTVQLTSVMVWILPLMEIDVADEQKVVSVLTTSVVQVVVA